MTEFDLTTLATIAEGTGHIGYVWDKATDRLTWRGPWQSLFAGSAETTLLPMRGDAFLSLIAPEDQAFVLDESAATYDRIYRIKQSENAWTWVHEHGRIDFAQGRAIRRTALVAVIDDPEKHPHISAHKDPLTGRPNRSAMMARLRHLMTGASDQRQKAACLVINIDRMAFFNEALGMKNADALLARVGDKVQSLLPETAFMARIGGDSFGVLLQDMAPETVETIAAILLRSFHDEAVPTPAGPLHVTLSIGSALFRNEGTDPAEIMIHAEHARQLARQKGRNEYVGYHESLARSQESRSVLDTIERVRKALRDGTLHLAYQPVISTETREILFYEALARMYDDHGQLLPAASFIPAVEQLGLAPEFDRHVLKLAIQELEESPDLTLAVNISGLTASLADWSAYVESLLANRADVARRLIIEITETAALMDVAETKLLVESLKNIGGRVALDDFGVGATSISHLRNLSLAIMKIDKELLTNLMTSVEQQHLVRMLIRIAHGLNLKTVVEGVETPDVAEWLRLEKADMLQGYLFGYPLLDKPWKNANYSRQITAHF